MREEEEQRERIRRESREWDRRMFSFLVAGWCGAGLVLLTVLALIWTGISWLWNHMG